MVSITQTELAVRDCEERLVVLVPEQLENIADFARQIYCLALGQQREVVYMALSSREGEALSNSRLLTTLEALTQSQALQVRSLKINAEHWTDALRMVTQPGDMVICPDPEIFSAGTEKTTSPGSALEKELGVSLQFLPEVYTSEKHLPEWTHTLVSWTVSLVILVGFSLLEIRLAGLISGGLKKTVLFLLVMLEFGILYIWDKIFYLAG